MERAGPYLSFDADVENPTSRWTTMILRGIPSPENRPKQYYCDAKKKGFFSCLNEAFGLLIMKQQVCSILNWLSPMKTTGFALVLIHFIWAAYLDLLVCKRMMSEPVQLGN